MPATTPSHKRDNTRNEGFKTVNAPAQEPTRASSHHMIAVPTTYAHASQGGLVVLGMGNGTAYPVEGRRSTTINRPQSTCSSAQLLKQASSRTRCRKTLCTHTLSLTPLSLKYAPRSAQTQQPHDRAQHPPRQQQKRTSPEAHSGASHTPSQEHSPGQQHTSTSRRR